MKVEKGMTIKIDYTGSLDDGTVFDTTDEALAKEKKIHQEKRPYTPIEVKIGEGMVIPGFENALIDMEKGEEKDIHIECKDAYGEPTDKAIQEVPKEVLGEKFDAKPGTKMMFKAHGHMIPGTIKEVGEKVVKIDFNHPLAGKDLNFKLKVVDIL